MSDTDLSSLDLRAFLRSCHHFLQEDMTLDSWTAFQKYLLLSGRPDFGLYIRQLKKLSDQQKKSLIDGFSSGQVESKLWLLEILHHVLPSVDLDVHILGSWFGLLPRMMTWLGDFKLARVQCYDIDSGCEPMAKFLNEPDSYSEKMLFYTQDMNKTDYSSTLKKNSLVINTSCEHLEDFPAWYSRLPQGSLLALQGNNFAEPEEHHSVWPNLEAFSAQTPMETILFSGQLNLPKYSRYMRIGVKA